MRDVRTVALLACIVGMSATSAGQVAQPAPQAAKIVAVKAARLIDGRGGAPISNAVVLIDNDRITAVGPGLAIPPGAQVIDLGAATVLPGFIDCHTHVTGQPGENYYEDLFRRSPIDEAVTAHVYAKRTLEAGFTTIRDVGSEEYIDVALQQRDQSRRHPGAADAGGDAGARRHRRPRRPQRVLAEHRVPGRSPASPTASTRSASSCASTSSTAPT